MTIMITKKQRWCCDLMPTFLEDPIVPISYDPILREFSIDLADDMIRQNVFYCPWCGRRLPDSLREEYFDVLEEEYGIEPDIDMLKNERLPQDFRSDAWWKKLNL